MSEEENKQKKQSGNGSGSNEKKAKTPPPIPQISEPEIFGGKIIIISPRKKNN